MPSKKKEVQPPVIVVPGITATALDDYYPVPPQAVWSAVLNKDYTRIAMHPDDPRYEAAEPARVQAGQPFDLVYGDLVDALRYDLSESPELPTPVFLFGYDWRQDCRAASALLADFIDEVLARTALIPHYRAAADAGTLRVDLVAHSMGGLIVVDCLARGGLKAVRRPKVRRVVTIATPFQGSIEAIEKVTTGMGAFTDEAPRSRERESARTIPAIYQLLPTWPRAIRPDAGQPGDLLAVDTWQPSILQTLGAYIDRHEARIDPRDLLSGYLSGLRALRNRGNRLDLSQALPEGQDGWMPIAGVGSRTRTHCKVIGYKNAPWFETPDAVDAWESDRTSTETGDGTVPFEGATPRRSVLPRERLVCVSPDQFALREVKDRALARAAGFHAALPNMNLVQRMTVSFLRPRFDTDLVAWPAPGVAAPVWPKHCGIVNLAKTG